MESVNFPWATLYVDDAFNYKDGKLMGRHAAGLSYIKAIASSKYDNAGFLLANEAVAANFVNIFKPLVPKEKKINIELIDYLNVNKSEKYGGIFIHDPALGYFSSLRSNFLHKDYSIIGITHTTMSDGVMNYINDLYTKPVMEWDALICTSKSVKETVQHLESYQEDMLRQKLDIKKITKPQLPIIPLGIHPEEFNHSKEQRNKARTELKIDKDDIVLIFVGRLSFHAKAHHFSMYKALGNLSGKVNKKIKIHLIQVGWFANDFVKDVFIKEAKDICPDINCIFLDGRNQNVKHDALAASDIFISLTDNFQETFGLTPLEGMASGKPVVVTDWNGYRDTVRNDIDGFTIPTTTLKGGDGLDMAYKYISGQINYDIYMAYTSQTVSVDIENATNKIEKLILNKELRNKMGDEAKKRAFNDFSWNNIVNMYSDLRDELNSIRQHSDESKTINYIKAIDPYHLFSLYPTNTLGDETKLGIVKEKKVDEDHYLFTSKSINLSNFNAVADISLEPKINIVNLILGQFKDQVLCLGDLFNNLDIDNIVIKRHVMMMIKFNLLNIVSDNE